MQALGGVGEQITVLVNRVALNGSAVPQRGDGRIEPLAAVDDEEFRPAQAAPDEIVEIGAPGLGRFIAHVLHGKQDLLTILAHTDDRQQ